MGYAIIMKPTTLVASETSYYEFAVDRDKVVTAAVLLCMWVVAWCNRICPMLRYLIRCIVPQCIVLVDVSMVLMVARLLWFCSLSWCALCVRVCYAYGSLVMRSLFCVCV